MTTSEQWTEDQITGAIDEWWKLVWVNNYAQVYLYFKPSTDTSYGAIAAAEMAPAEGWELAMPERISSGWTKEQALAKIKPIVWRLPILPSGGAK